jgi:hypothetical protein
MPGLRVRAPVAFKRGGLKAVLRRPQVIDELFTCGGLRALAMRIDKDPNPEHLPTPHTCFNTIAILEYSDWRVLKEKLLVALAKVTGSGRSKRFPYSEKNHVTFVWSSDL